MEIQVIRAVRRRISFDILCGAVNNRPHVRTSAVPTGLDSFYHADPGLTSWAMICRPAGWIYGGKKRHRKPKSQQPSCVTSQLLPQSRAWVYPHGYGSFGHGAGEREQ